MITNTSDFTETKKLCLIIKVSLNYFINIPDQLKAYFFVMLPARIEDVQKSATSRRFNRGTLFYTKCDNRSKVRKLTNPSRICELSFIVLLLRRTKWREILPKMLPA